jgi:hypothetical protein
MRMTLAALGLVLVTGSAFASPQRVTYALGTDDPQVRALAERGTLMLKPERACEGAVLVRRDFNHGSTQDPAFRYECTDVDRKSVVSLEASAIRAFDPSKPQSVDYFGNRSLDSQR